MPIENLVFSGGDGFPLGAVAGYAIKRVMKIAVIGLFVVGNGEIKLPKQD